MHATRSKLGHSTAPLVFAALLSFHGLAAAQPPPPAAPPAPSAGALTPPMLLTRAEATYPPDALRERLEGTVGVELVIGEDGRVVDARVKEPAGHGFDEAALEAARKLTFVPARRSGVPIRASVRLGYEFHPPPLPATPPPAAPPPLPPPLAPKADLQEGTNQTTLVVAKSPPHASLQEPESLAASDSSTDQRELSLRPRMRAEGVLEAVPGLFTVQHAGGGKSQQYFLRGFDLDHGTDFAVFVDGQPVNAVSHAHGQGYSDMHFIIPETIDTLESTKGPYSARVGDFATAGAISFHMANHVDESMAKVEIGGYGHKRAVVVESPSLGENWRMVVAAEAFNEDGAFIHPESFDRLNAYLKVTRVIDKKSEVSLMLMGYGGSWNMSGVLPARAVCGEGDGTPRAPGPCLSRWDSVDPSQGGASQRFEALTSYARRLEDGDLEATLFGLHSNLQLYPNDGIAASFQPAGMQYGSQVEQDDIRTEIGGNIRVTKNLKLGDMSFRSTIGLQFRYDGVDSELHRDEQRQRLDGMPGIAGPIADSAINETQLGAYFEEDWHPTSWLRFVLGGRADRIDADVSNQSPVALDKVSGYKGATQMSPKATMTVSPVKQLDLFANYGRGFHSNDVRTILAGSVAPGANGANVFAPAPGANPTLLATATGYEAGAVVKPVEGLSFSGSLFLLDLTSELTIDGDIASTTPSKATRRYGVEVSGRYNFRNNVYVDASFTVAHARYTDAADIAAGTDYVTLAPVRTFSGGVGTRQPVGQFTIIASTYVRSMSDRAGTQDNKLTATGFTTVNGELGLRWRMIEVGADVINIGNAVYREGQFAVNSRLPGEGPNPQEGMSFTPGQPRTGLVHAIVYW